MVLLIFTTYVFIDNDIDDVVLKLAYAKTFGPLRYGLQVWHCQSTSCFCILPYFASLNQGSQGLGRWVSSAIAPHVRSSSSTCCDLASTVMGQRVERENGSPSNLPPHPPSSSLLGPRSSQVQLSL